ncbi:MAG: 6,7-dimethyl-8-ribityllumazine synthase [Gammaproteobacteria bacterium]|nr:6,7-dimethyl-8-ribityllumazine synthase [Gammaproteobacteria bacterium]
MSQSVIDLNNLPKIANPGRIAILKSKWYPELTDEMANVAEKVLRNNGYRLIEVHTLPGSLELPLAASDLLSTDIGGEIDAIICFGVIVKGDTLHFEMITEECVRGLGAVMREYRRPIIVEILPVFTLEDAAAHAGKNSNNKGYEAAAAAIEMVAWRRGIT